jgi:hypothetical protein
MGGCFWMRSRASCNEVCVLEVKDGKLVRTGDIPLVQTREGLGGVFGFNFVLLHLFLYGWIPGSKILLL